MLHVDRDAVEALRRHDLGRERIAYRTPAVDRWPAGRPEVFQPVRDHAHIPRTAKLQAANLATIIAEK